MLRYFSRILIFTLILTAPLSFTGDSCPDFKPNCELQRTTKLKSAAVVVQKRSATFTHHAPTPLVFENTVTQHPPIQLTFDLDANSSPLHERAPPSSLLS